ncbi:MAG: T9SS type A sorting domain-containing protein [Crocinitomicaceae bacterium]
MKKLILFFGGISSMLSFAQMTTVGSATQFGGCNCYQLTPAVTTAQKGAIWSPNTIDLTQDFDMTFEVYFGPSDAYGADGMTFVLQENPSGIGDIGFDLGYGGASTISFESLAIEMDVFKSTSTVPSDPVDDHIAMNQNGSVQHNLVSPVSFPGSQDIEDSQYHEFRVVWTAGFNTLAVYWEGTGFPFSPLISYTGDIVTDIFGGTTDVYFGFTASTGGFVNDMRVCSNSNSTFSADLTTVCPGTTIQFTETSLSDISVNESWSWDFGDGSALDVTENPAYAYTTSGDYTVELTYTDGFGCDYVTTTDVTILPDITMDMDSTSVTCFGDTDGTGTGVPTNGTGPYVYSWNDGSTQATQTATGLAPGVYALTVTDNLGCTGMDSITVIEPLEILLAMGRTDISCFGDSTGEAGVIVTNGVPGLTYSWNDYLGQTLDTAANLPTGMYTVVVTDANGCTATDSIFISQSPEIIISGIAADDNGTGTGSIDITVSGGAAPYTYSWDNAETTEDISGLASGFYTVTVTDANGCMVSMQFEVKSSASIGDLSSIGFSVYPNPSEGILNINGSGDYKLSVYDTSGRLIIEQTENGLVTIDLSHVESGLYLLQLSVDNQHYLEKILIK